MEKHLSEAEIIEMLGHEGYMNMVVRTKEDAVKEMKRTNEQSCITFACYSINHEKWKSIAFEGSALIIMEGMTHFQFTSITASDEQMPDEALDRYNEINKLKAERE